MPEGGGQPPQMPDGDVQPPQMPNGEHPPQMPNGEQPPQMPNGEQPPQMPDGDDQPPQMPDGFGGGRGDKGDKGDKGGRGESRPSYIRVHLNGHILKFNTDPYLKNDSTMVGFRSILEALGATVKWDEDTQTVTAEKDDTSIILTIGSTSAYVNGEEKPLLAAPELTADTTMIPVRFVSEALGMKVGWDDSCQLVTITSK